MSNTQALFEHMNGSKTDSARYAKMFSTLMCQMRKMREEDYSDPKVIKTALEYLEQSKICIQNESDRKNIQSRMGNRLVKLAKIRKDRAMAAKLADVEPKADAGSAEKEENGEDTPTKDDTASEPPAKEDAPKDPANTEENTSPAPAPSDLSTLFPSS